MMVAMFERMKKWYDQEEGEGEGERKVRSWY
jgi:hypothetical protein